MFGGNDWLVEHVEMIGGQRRVLAAAAFGRSWQRRGRRHLRGRTGQRRSVVHARRRGPAGDGMLDLGQRGRNNPAEVRTLAGVALGDVVVDPDRIGLFQLHPAARLDPVLALVGVDHEKCRDRIGSQPSRLRDSRIVENSTSVPSSMNHTGLHCRRPSAHNVVKTATTGWSSNRCRARSCRASAIVDIRHACEPDGRFRRGTWETAAITVTPADPPR